MQRKNGERTLWMSVLMSAPGPLIIAWGLRVGQSATQVADLVRRSSELAAMIVALTVYLLCRKSADEARNRLEKRANLAVGAAMCLSGGAMLLLTFLGDQQTGNVLPGLIVAAMGFVANTLFWRKYTRLGRESGNRILAVQGRLYGAKSLVDGCVTLALAAVMLLPGSAAAAWLDTVGSCVVAGYLVWCGLRTLREAAG